MMAARFRDLVGVAAVLGSMSCSARTQRPEGAEVAALAAPPAREKSFAAFESGQVLTRFDDSISVLDVRAGHEVGHVPRFNPEPPSITKGRRFVYDATLSSGHGDSAWATGHVFGDFDSLAWDLGAPDDVVAPIPGPFAVDPAAVPPGSGRRIALDRDLDGVLNGDERRGG